MTPRTIIVHTTHQLGDLISRFMDWLSGCRRFPEWAFRPLYWWYSKLMEWSGDLDKDEVVWLHRHESETERDFIARCLQKFGE